MKVCAMFAMALITFFCKYLSVLKNCDILCEKVKSKNKKFKKFHYLLNSILFAGRQSTRHKKKSVALEKVETPLISFSHYR